MKYTGNVKIDNSALSYASRTRTVTVYTPAEESSFGSIVRMFFDESNVTHPESLPDGTGSMLQLIDQQ